MPSLARRHEHAWCCQIQKKTKKENGRFRAVTNGSRRVADGNPTVTDGDWRVDDGGWTVNNGGWRANNSGSAVLSAPEGAKKRDEQRVPGPQSRLWTHTLSDECKCALLPRPCTLFRTTRHINSASTTGNFGPCDCADTAVLCPAGAGHFCRASGRQMLLFDRAMQRVPTGINSLGGTQLPHTFSRNEGKGVCHK